MKFFSRESSEKLAKMGCATQSRFYYGRLKDEVDHDLASLTKEQISEIDCLWYDVDYDGGLILKRVGPYLLSDGLNVFNPKRDMIFLSQRFETIDFLSSEAYALENWIKLTPAWVLDEDKHVSAQWSRFKMLNAEDQIAFVEGFLRGEK